MNAIILGILGWILFTMTAPAVMWGVYGVSLALYVARLTAFLKLKEFISVKLEVEKDG